MLHVSKDKLEWGIELLSDILLNSKYGEDFIEQEKSTIRTELLECLREEAPSLLEFGHRNFYRNHPIGKPVLGDIRNINSVNRKMLVEFH